MRPVIELSVGEWSVAQHIAVLRQAINREAGRINLKAGPQDVMTTEVVGICGELAFCRWANVYPDLSVHLRSGSFDATWRGWSVDVKSTRNPDGVLYLDARKVPHMYALAHVDALQVTLLGWISGAAAHKHGQDRLPQHLLYTFDEIPEWNANNYAD
jgi:hypothetical protein